MSNLLEINGKIIIAVPNINAVEKKYFLEQWIAFDREVSAIGARNVDGEITVYPITEN